MFISKVNHISKLYHSFHKLVWISVSYDWTCLLTYRGFPIPHSGTGQPLQLPGRWKPHGAACKLLWRTVSCHHLSLCIMWPWATRKAYTKCSMDVRNGFPRVWTLQLFLSNFSAFVRLLRWSFHNKKLQYIQVYSNISLFCHANLVDLN